MDLYFSPLACSLATRIALYEAGTDARYLEVDPRTKIVQSDGSNFREVNPLGLVPTLRTDDGLVLTENAAILQYVADRFLQAGIATGPGMDRSRLHQWLCFIGTELHKGLFVPLLDKNAPPEMKTYVLGKGLSRLDYLENYLKGRNSCSTISASPTAISSRSSTGPWRRRRSNWRNGLL
jgi:glutathione S-transferase